MARTSGAELVYRRKNREASLFASGGTRSIRGIIRPDAWWARIKPGSGASGLEADVAFCLFLSISFREIVPIKTVFAVALGVALSVGFCSPLLAQKEQPDAAGLFKKLDSDGNGQLSLEEFAASQKPVDKQLLEKKMAQKQELAGQKGKQPVDKKAPMKEGAEKQPGEKGAEKKFDKNADQKNVKNPGDAKKPVQNVLDGKQPDGQKADVKKPAQPDGGKKVDKNAAEGKQPEKKQPDQKKPDPKNADGKQPEKKQPEKNAEKSEKVVK